MATSTEPIIVQIVNEGSSAIKSGIGGGSSGGKKGSNVDLLSGLGKLTGIVAIIAELGTMIYDAVMSVAKPIKTVLSAIFKLIAQLLRPIVDVVMILLMPILQLIKPFVKLFTQLMQPFRKIAYDLMKQASNVQGGISSPTGMALIFQAITTLLSGMLTSIWVVVGDMLKTMIINPIFELLKAVLPIFSSQLEDARVTINEGIDGATKGIYQATLDTMKTAANNTKAALTGMDIKTPIDNWATLVGIQMEKSLRENAVPNVSSGGGSSGGFSMRLPSATTSTTPTVTPIIPGFSGGEYNTIGYANFINNLTARP